MESTRPLARRTVLTGMAAAGIAAPVAACTGSDEPARQRPRRAAPTTAAPEGDTALVAGALGDEHVVSDFCRAASRAHRSLRPALAPLQTRQQALISALTDAVTDPVMTRRHRIDVPRRPRDVFRQVTQLLSAAEQDRLDDCLAAESGLLARLFASASASHAVAVEHVRALP